MSLDPAQRAGLERARAIALAREQFELDASIDGVEVDAAPFGVTVHSSDRAVVVVSSDDLAVLGGVLVWIDRLALKSVALVTEHHAGVHARRAAVLAPEAAVYESVDAMAHLVEAAPLGRPQPSLPDDTRLIALIERSGAQAVVEDGIVRAEVSGLEVGRIVTGDDGSVLEVGVGRFDREAGAVLHGDRPTESTLVDVIARVKAHRYTGALSHAINRIGRERWLRDLIRLDPGLVGIENPQLVDPIPPRTSLLEAGPAALCGQVGDDRILVACTVGADLGLVPEMADLIAAVEATRALVVIPERDHLPYLDSLLARLPMPAVVQSIVVPWVG